MDVSSSSLGLHVKMISLTLASPATASEVPAEPEDDGRILGVTVHRSDRLKTDLYVRHPLVRVHIVDMNTGAAVKKSSE